MNLMESLLAARASISDEEQPFVFAHWNTCACGHIYAAARGKRVLEHSDEQVPNAVRYDPTDSGTQAVRAVAELMVRSGIAADGTNDENMKILEGYLEEEPHFAVSDGFVWWESKHDLMDGDRRAHAVAFVDELIAALKAEEVAAMQAVAEDA